MLNDVYISFKNLYDNLAPLFNATISSLHLTTLFSLPGCSFLLDCMKAVKFVIHFFEIDQQYSEQEWATSH